jgi:hypothetical protein
MAQITLRTPALPWALLTDDHGSRGDRNRKGYR